jgi:hypothetical protein
VLWQGASAVTKGIKLMRKALFGLAAVTLVAIGSLSPAKAQTPGGITLDHRSGGYDSGYGKKYDGDYGKKYDGRHDDKYGGYGKNHGDDYSKKHDDRHDSGYGKKYGDDYGKKYDGRHDDKYGSGYGKKYGGYDNGYQRYR